MISSFFKFIFLIFLTVFLSACGNMPSIEIAPENTGSLSGKVEYMISTTTGPITATGIIYSSGFQDIIKRQIKEGPQVIVDVNCDIYNGEDREYCMNEKKKVEDHKNEITWESVLKKGPDYIKSFDCSTIFSSFGQNYCSEYKLNLPK